MTLNLPTQVVESLVKLEIDVSKEGRQVASEIVRYLDQQYSYSCPRKTPASSNSVLWETFRQETIGTRQFALEKGKLKGQFYRILEHPDELDIIHCFAWSHHKSEQQVLEEWDEFVTMLKTLEELPKLS